MKGLIPKANESLGSVVGVVNNASLFSFDRIESLSEELWIEHMKVNAFAPLVLIVEKKILKELNISENVLVMISKLESTQIKAGILKRL